MERTIRLSKAVIESAFVQKNDPTGRTASVAILNETPAVQPAYDAIALRRDA
jgi:Tfp pilus assembly ATPase PilU